MASQNKGIPIRIIPNSKDTTLGVFLFKFNSLVMEEKQISLEVVNPNAAGIISELILFSKVSMNALHLI